MPRKANPPTWLPVVFAVTIFLSAFLLFQVQPLLGKFILPWFGGTPSVWTTCMLFFQVMLFAGYCYSHWLMKWSPRWQAAIHVTMLLLACGLLPITPANAWKPAGSEDPTLQILLLLAASVGLPYFLLSSTGPLLQAWFGVTFDGKSPYRLYALSNIGSLLALVTYPFVFEPSFSSGTQTVYWSIGFGLFAVLCTVTAFLATRKAARADEQDGEQDGESKLRSVAAENREAPRPADRVLWFALSASASVLLLATTNQVCMDVASVPFLWVLPLSLYLLTFILCFDGKHWYHRRGFAWGMAISSAATGWVMLNGSLVPILAQIACFFTTFFTCCMFCHGELVRLKPHPRYLTSFYLTLAAGGAVGGILVGIVAPLVFPAFFELHIGMFACIVLALAVYYRDASWVLYRGQPRFAWVAMILGTIWLGTVLFTDARTMLRGVEEVRRNFYGVLRISRLEESDGAEQLAMVHGRIVHGTQFLDSARRGWATTYYGTETGVGLALRAKQQPGQPTSHAAPVSSKGLHVGAIGLGTGTVATYGRAGDRLRFYEINDDVIHLAKKHFSFLRDTPADVEIVLGDARLALEREQDQQFDVLIVDAFSGDAIPTHLLSAEAMEVYLRHLQRDGILAIHCSNLHFDLEPVIAALGRHAGLSATFVRTEHDDQRGVNGARWALLSPTAAVLDTPVIADAGRPLGERMILWTDDRCNLFEVLNRKIAKPQPDPNRQPLPSSDI